ncbi:cyclic pyranopterin monophosphate synthase MoaC [Enorma phocaeensis]|uniref:Cyclic pyranopterin monophosphate synthase n=1 Tax=Enorma phocaeensis TaxID=1871019 RepID=A0ABT7V8S7_9ACTN|nr:cyclic pyranopterin monophosphate synthase MoaC [Enorma phocaeensis]MDM8274903.1 cyclic pyranopterin monophosphate synthase MoaC [Enorma phocaeensis]
MDARNNTPAAAPGARDAYRDTLTHVDERGDVRMVDVSEKAETKRIAIAEGSILMHPETQAMVLEDRAKKGDVLACARVAGIMASKRTSDLIPMCHPLMITKSKVDILPIAPAGVAREGWAPAREDGRVGFRVRATCGVTGVTGIEMEALTAASVACLTIYDMCKAVDRGMEVVDVRLLRKEGGRSGLWERGGQGAPEASESVAAADGPVVQTAGASTSGVAHADAAGASSSGPLASTRMQAGAASADDVARAVPCAPDAASASVACDIAGRPAAASVAPAAAHAPAIAFVGYQNSGKTTLVEKVINILTARGLRVGSIKHHGHAGFDIDVPGKDSWRHAQAGSRHVGLISADRYAEYADTSEEFPLERMLERYTDVDVVIVEGYKTAGLPNFVVARSGVDRRHRASSVDLVDEHTIALACNDVVARQAADSVRTVDINDARAVADLVREALSGLA